MKWNDIVNHMKKNSGMPATAPVTPVVSSENQTTPVRSVGYHVRKWIPVTIIFLVIIAGVVIAYLLIKNNKPDTDALFKKDDAAYVDQFFKNNPPAQLTPTEMQNIKSILQTGNPTSPVSAPVLKPVTSKTPKK